MLSKLSYNVSWLAEVGAEFAKSLQIITKHRIMTEHSKNTETPNFCKPLLAVVVGLQ